MSKLKVNQSYRMTSMDEINESLMFLTQPKTRGKKGKRKRRKSAVEKRMEHKEEDETLPWPPPPEPDEASLTHYNELLRSSYRKSGVEANANPCNWFQPGLGVQKNMDKYFGLSLGLLPEGSGTRGRCSPIQHQHQHQHLPQPPTVPLMPQSSEDVCTLFRNSCQVVGGSGGGRRTMPPIGVFWDIENCAVPRGKSALVAVQRIRERFFPGHYEAEFACVCDIRKESAGIIQELNDAQVTVIHVSGNSKNAADDKLRQAMRRFADVYAGPCACSSTPYPATIILISGDINFSTELSDLKHRKKLYVILLHNKHAPEALLLCAHENYDFHTFLYDLPRRPLYRDKDNTLVPQSEPPEDIPLKGGLQPMDVFVLDLPHSNSKNHTSIRNCLKKLSENCGGKVITVQGQFGIIRFPNKEAAMRASKRMNGEDVLGSKIRVIYSSQMEFRNQQENPQVRGSEEGASTSYRGHQKTVWRPTWRNSNSRTNVYPSPSSARTGLPMPGNSKCNLTHAEPTFPVPAPSSTGSTSTSTSPTDSSREESPEANGSPAPVIRSSTPLNNSVRPAPRTFNASFGSDRAHPLEFQNQDADSSSQTLRLYSVRMPLGPVSASSYTNASSSIPHDLHGLQGPGSASAPSFPTPSIDSQMQLMGISLPKRKGKLGGEDGFDLFVTNIDPTLGDWKTVRLMLLTAFSEHVIVKGVWVHSTQDGGVSAVVRVGSKEEGHYAVAQLHRKPIGQKRIFISFDEGSSVPPDTLRKEVASLLHDVPGLSLPFFKFREMFEKRYRRSVSTSELHKIRDVVSITDACPRPAQGQGPMKGIWGLGKTISLTEEWKAKDKNVSLYCSMHPPRRGLSKAWAEKKSDETLPNVIIEFKVLSTRLNTLLISHNGTIPLISFLDCYEAEFGKLEAAEGNAGVSLEHLLASVKGVEIAFSDNGMKRIQLADNSVLDSGVYSQALATQRAQFSREMIDLLKTFPRCTLPFSKLIPEYHHHFGRQCRVADYGHFNLPSLLQTIPQVVQVMGASQNRVITLAHKAQIKRFANDLLRVLKAQGGVKKQIKVSDFPEAFTQVFPTRQFAPEDYGLCFFSDLIAEVVENFTSVAVIKDEEGNQMLAIPKREQTMEEIQRTRTFAAEVIELFRHSIRYEMPFSKFIPAYHHHFGKQCRVSYYGLAKLAELFEAISDTIQIVNPPKYASDFSIDDKILRLVPHEQIKVVGEQLARVVHRKTERGTRVRLEDIDEIFVEEYGFHLCPETCEADSTEDLVKKKLQDYLKVERGVVTALRGSDSDPESDEKSTKDKDPKLGPFTRYCTNKAYYAEQFRQGQSRWGDLSFRRNRAAPPQPLFIPPHSSMSPMYSAGMSHSENGGVFSYDRVPSAPMSNPQQMYDMWMREPLSPGSPTVSSPVVWTYHPIVYPPNTPPANAPNIMVPAFSYNGPWSPAPVPQPCYE